MSRKVFHNTNENLFPSILNLEKKKKIFLLHIFAKIHNSLYQEKYIYIYTIVANCTKKDRNEKSEDYFIIRKISFHYIFSNP